MKTFNLWPTTMMVHEVEDEELMSESLAFLMSNRKELVNKENKKSCILENEPLKQLKEKVFLPAFDKYLQETCNRKLDDWSYNLNGWLVSYGEGQSLNYHNHRGSQLSSVLYMMADSEDDGGDVLFTDPRQNANRGYDLHFSSWFESFRLKPKCGQLIVFPSFLYHYVETYRSNIRMALPVDCFLQNKHK